MSWPVWELELSIEKVTESCVVPTSLLLCGCFPDDTSGLILVAVLTRGGLSRNRVVCYYCPEELLSTSILCGHQHSRHKRPDIVPVHCKTIFSPNNKANKERNLRNHTNKPQSKNSWSLGQSKGINNSWAHVYLDRGGTRIQLAFRQNEVFNQITMRASRNVTKPAKPSLDKLRRYTCKLIDFGSFLGWYSH